MSSFGEGIGGHEYEKAQIVAAAREVLEPYPALNTLMGQPHSILGGAKEMFLDIFAAQAIDAVSDSLESNKEFLALGVAERVREAVEFLQASLADFKAHITAG